MCRHLLSSLAVAVIFTVVSASNTTSTSEPGHLLFATVLYRHGDRTPFKPYPTDPYASAKFWPSGWGQLTNSGKQQHLELGKWLRHRYLGAVLRDRYHRDDIYIESTDFDRTLMSATINSAALFPVEEAADAWATKGTLGSLWQPIPVHTTPKELDERLWCGRPCPAFDHQLAEITRRELHHYNVRHPHLMQYLRKHTGSPIADMWDVLSIYDTLLVQAANNFTLPEWAHRVFTEDGVLRHATLNAYSMQSKLPSMARLKFGWLLREILQTFRDKAAGQLRPVRRSMWVYSAHDSTVSGMLNTLGMFEWHFPPYAATLLFELRRVDDEEYVQIFYRNSTTVEPTALEIPECGQLCPLGRMFELYEPVLPTGSYEEECRWPTDGAAASDNVNSTGQRSAAGVPALSGLIIVFVMCALLA